ncbi:MAG: indole-3-glycerol phosphate synthase TrpC [Bacteroidia bacterium]|nr:indole-3-glycerol phosphate synthase TrpC [Bacteroidia bacterium]
MNILEKIISYKKKEVENRKSLFPAKLLEQSVYFSSPCVSLKKYLKREDKLGIIAEIKRKSPSKGNINPYVNIERTSIGYMMAGASALSILTDTEFFGGKNEDLTTARKYNYCPILRKDFIIDEYQIIEAKSIGADAILLLANVLSVEETKKLTAFAHSFGLEVLLELHDENELGHISAETDIVGINNRNLKDFKVNLEHSINMLNKLPKEKMKIAESGISAALDLTILRDAGFDGFLIGEFFMRHSRPEEKCKSFILEVNALNKKSITQ